MLQGSRVSVKGFPRLRLCGNRAPSESSEICNTDRTKGDSMFCVLKKFRFLYCFTNKQIHTWKQLQHHLVTRGDASAEVCLPALYAEFCLYFEALLGCWETFSYFHIPNYRREFPLVTHVSFTSHMFMLTRLKPDWCRQKHRCSFYYRSAQRTPLCCWLAKRCLKLQHQTHSIHLAFWTWGSP